MFVASSIRLDLLTDACLDVDFGIAWRRETFATEWATVGFKVEVRAQVALEVAEQLLVLVTEVAPEQDEVRSGRAALIGSNLDHSIVLT